MKIITDNDIIFIHSHKMVKLKSKRQWTVKISCFKEDQLDDIGEEDHRSVFVKLFQEKKIMGS